MLFCKKCKCSGIATLGDQTIAKICPKCKLKNSFVVFPDIFSSVSVEKPHCYKIDEVNYLVTSGRGVYIEGGTEAEGIYTLTLADGGTETDGFAFSFISVNPDGISIIYLLAIILSVDFITIDKCSGLCTMKKKYTTVSNQVSHLNHALSGKGGICARKLTIYTDGRMVEEDLSSRFQSLMNEE